MAVSSFRYLGKILLSSDNYWPEVEQNLWRAWGKWGRLSKILGREGYGRRTTERFDVAVVQAVLLFRSKTWVLNPRLEKSLEGFHHQSVWQMASMSPKPQRDVTWVCPLIGTALIMVVLQDIGVYISHHQNTVTQYIVTRPIMDLCLTTEKNPGMCLSRR